MGKLNTKKIESIKANPDKDIKIADGDGLWLKVAKSGRKTFTFRYSYATERREMTLGPYPELGLADARSARIDQSRILTAGKDPLQQKETQRSALNSALTVSELIDQYYERVLRSSYQHPEDAKAILDRDMSKKLGKRLIVDVSKRDIVEVINSVKDRGAKVSANRLRSQAKKMFDYAVDQDLITSNPVQLSRKHAGGKETSRNRNLSLSEIANLITSLPPNTSEMAWQTRSALFLILATGQRPGEVCGMEWSELDIDQGTWHIPAAKAKSKRPHVVILNAPAIRLIQQARCIAGNSTFVLASPVCPETNIERHSVSRAISRLFDKQLLRSVAPFTPHDLRRTVASRMGDLKVAPHVIEKTLNHVMTGVMAVYNHAEYLEERRDAAAAWGAKLDEFARIETAPLLTA
jgi:integrase